MQTLLEYISKKSSSDYNQQIKLGMDYSDVCDIVRNAIGIKKIKRCPLYGLDAELETVLKERKNAMILVDDFRNDMFFLYISFDNGELFGLGFIQDKSRLESVIYTDKYGRPNSSTDISIEKLNKILRI